MVYNIKNSKQLASLINYTNLNNIITESEMREFLEKAKELNFHSVVVSPTYVCLAKEELKDTDIKVGSVIGFPLGFEDTPSKVAEAKALLDKGVDEFEVVLNLSHLKDEKYELLEDEIRQMKEAVGDKLLKVIVETKALEDYQIANASKVAEKSGADYVKTSTGFSTGGATVEDIALMRKTVGPEIGVKASGGVRSLEDAKAMTEAGATRIGASSGVSIAKGETASTDY